MFSEFVIWAQENYLDVILWNNHLESVGTVKWASINIQAAVWVDEQSVVLIKEVFAQMNKLEVWFDSSNSAKINELHE